MGSSNTFIGVITLFQSLYDLISTAKERAEDIDLRFYGTFDETAVHVLDESVNENTRIFILISDEIRTRNTLCEVMIIITGAGSLTK